MTDKVATFSDFCAWVQREPYRNYIVGDDDFAFLRARCCAAGLLPRDEHGRPYIEFGEHRVTLATACPDLGPELDLVTAGRTILDEIGGIFEGRRQNGQS